MKARTNPSRGFTLIEVLTALAILSLFVALALPVFISSLRSLEFTNNRFCLNRDLRFLSARLMKEARASGLYYIYKSFDDRTKAAAGESGNFLVLCALDAKGINVTKTIGYYRDTDLRIRRFEADEPGDSPIPAAIPASSTAAAHPIVVECAKGKTNTETMFFNMNNGSIVLYGQIRNDGNSKPAETAINRPAVSSYNLTITPRG